MATLFSTITDFPLNDSYDLKLIVKRNPSHFHASYSDVKCPNGTCEFVDYIIPKRIDNFVNLTLIRYSTCRKCGFFDLSRVFHCRATIQPFDCVNKSNYPMMLSKQGINALLDKSILQPNAFNVYVNIPFTVNQFAALQCNHLFITYTIPPIPTIQMRPKQIVEPLIPELGCGIQRPPDFDPFDIEFDERGKPLYEPGKDMKTYLACLDAWQEHFDLTAYFDHHPESWWPTGIDYDDGFDPNDASDVALEASVHREVRHWANKCGLARDDAISRHGKHHK